MGPVSSGLSRRDFVVLFSRGAGGLAVLGAAAACGGGGGGGGGGNGSFQGESPVSHLDAVLAAAPFHVAAGLGYYKEAQLELELVSYSGGSETIRAIAQDTFGMPATLPGLIAFQKGQQNLRIISGGFNRTLVRFLVPANSSIRDPEDLRNKKIAVSQPDSITTYQATTITRKLGLTPGKNVQILHVGGPPDAWTAAKQGVVDVAWSVPPLADELVESGEARLLFSGREYFPNFADNTYWTTDSVIEDSPDALRRWLRAQRRAMDTIKNDVEAAAAVYAKRVGITEDLARKALRAEADGFTLEIEPAAIEENVRAGVELGQLDAKKLDLNSVIVKDFVSG
ncbi:MAG: hypothetical protein GEV03_13865 [Streptosporangiales bacterium]|nr:hypothetical protein [Streptosporangiales bacterium]